MLVRSLALIAALAFPGAAVAETVTARVGVIPIIGIAPYVVAEGEGLLKASGIETKLTTFESGPHMIQAVASGTIDVYIGGIAPLAVARSKGVDIRVIAATATGENVFVAGSRLAPYFTGKTPADAFKAFHAATGKAARLATQPAGSVPNTTLQYWLWEVAKADRADAEVVPMGIDATQQAVLAGAVDGAIVREPAVSIITGRNPAVKLIATGNELFPNQPGTVVAVTGAFADKYPQATQALVAGLIKATGIIAKTPDKAVPHIEAALGKGIVDTDTIKAALASPATHFEIDPRKVIEPARAMQAYQVRLGSLDTELPFDGLFVTKYYERAAAN
ncbi:MAG: ABC transporter substrate-binding protein [Ancalomicrobiaceae bacterium]|nr:ABC transporter substrate-binding protein [Ancalomicrobiaceae bacterium]